MVKSKDQDKKSFWASLPGMLTALAGLISALTGLFVAFHSGSGDKPKTDNPASAPSSKNSTAPVPEKHGVQTVRIRSSVAGGSIASYGFFTPKGYLVASTHTLGNAAEVSVTWVSDGTEQQQSAQVMGPGSVAPEATLLRLIGTQPVPRDVGIRVSGSLQPGEKVARYVGPNDTTPGSVKELYGQRDVQTESGMRKMARLLITTEIAGFGDSGAPVIDSEGRIVGMLFGASPTEAICIPIEDIKASFLDAFSKRETQALMSFAANAGCVVVAGRKGTSTPTSKPV